MQLSEILLLIWQRIACYQKSVKGTFSEQNLTTFVSSWTTKSMHFKLGSRIRAICFLTMASKAMSGVNRPTLTPESNSLRNYKADLVISLSFSLTYNATCFKKKYFCTVNVSNCKGDLPSESNEIYKFIYWVKKLVLIFTIYKPELFFIKFHSNYFIRESFMK